MLILDLLKTKSGGNAVVLQPSQGNLLPYILISAATKAIYFADLDFTLGNANDCFDIFFFIMSKINGFEVAPAGLLRTTGNILQEANLGITNRLLLFHLLFI